VLACEMGADIVVLRNYLARSSGMSSSGRSPGMRTTRRGRCRSRRVGWVGCHGWLRDFAGL